MSKFSLKPNQKLFIISGPSGVGKDTVIEGLKKLGLDFTWVISTTDRAMRKGEKEGKPYHFVSADEFKSMIEGNQFIEYKKIYDFCSGTTFKALQDAFQKTNIVIWKNYPLSLRGIKKMFPAAILIAILPPSIEMLEKRLRSRGTDSEEAIRERVKSAKEDLKALNFVDYKVINPEGHPEKATEEVFKIIQNVI